MVVSGLQHNPYYADLTNPTTLGAKMKFAHTLPTAHVQCIQPKLGPKAALPCCNRQ